MRYRTYIAISITTAAMWLGLLMMIGSNSTIVQAANRSQENQQEPIRIKQIMAGANGNSQIQFIEMEVMPKQTGWGPQGNETVGRAMLLFFDGNGTQTGRFVFPHDPPSGGHSGKVLIATQAFADLAGVPQPDIIMPAEIIAISGQVCFTGNPDNPNPLDLSTCLSYGELTPEGAGEREKADSLADSTGHSLPIVGVSSLRRVDHNNNRFGFWENRTAETEKFELGAPSLSNSQRDPFMIPVALLTEQGRTLFMEETFNGNGRTCADCHLPEDHFGLEPSTIDTLPPTHTLFIAEFNLNTLLLTADAQPSDLRGTITDENGVSARVLTGNGPQTYLIYDGEGISGTVTDGNGNSATVQSFTLGDLNQLEDSQLMRSGQALIMENIDGFDFDPVMRSSPHLLNINLTEPFGLSGHVTTLSTFTTDAIKQHAPRRLARVEDTDFRLPTDEESDAIDAFMRSISMPADQNFDLERLATTESQKRGRALFFGEANCSACHDGTVLANSDGSLPNSVAGQNENFNTGIVNLPQNLPLPEEVDQESGEAREFNTPALFGIRETAPYFHDNSIPLLRDAVGFYTSQQFADSPPGESITISLSETQIDDITAFLETLIDLPFTFTRQIDFGSQAVSDGATSAQSVTITIPTTGTRSLSISNVALTTAGAKQFTITNTPSNSAFGAGQSRTINVAFDPTTVGVMTATLEIIVNDANDEETWSVGVALSGRGTNATTTPTPTATLTATPSQTATSTPTPSQTTTSTPTPSQTTTSTPTASQTATSTPTTASQTATSTATASQTATSTPTTASQTATSTPTTASQTATSTATASQTATSTPTATSSPTSPLTATATNSPTPTPTTTGSVTPIVPDTLELKVSPAYGFDNVPTLIYIHGHQESHFTRPLTVTLGNDLLEVTYVDSELIAAIVPDRLPAGMYNITVQYGSDQSETMVNAYEVLHAAAVHDLLSFDEWMWTNPFPLRVGYTRSSVGLFVQYLGGRNTIDEVEVEFWLNDPITGTLLNPDGPALTNLLAPFEIESTNPVFWEPEEAGEYTICAVIDPNNLVEESNEENNTVCRDLTVQPLTQDSVPPQIEPGGFVISDYALTTPQITVTLDVMNTTDYPNPGASGLQAIKYVEFEYILGAHRWVPVQRTPWITYTSAYSDYPWTLAPTFGMRYMQAWISDNAGHISSNPGSDVIDLLPSEQPGFVAKNSVVFYRILLEEGESFTARLTPVDGDPDLYVWGPNGQLWYDQPQTGVEEVIIDEAPVKGTYQIEIHGYTEADYLLEFNPTDSRTTATTATMTTMIDDPFYRTRSGDRIPPSEPAVPLDEWPKFYDVEAPPVVEASPSTLYLPITTR